MRGEEKNDCAFYCTPSTTTVSDGHEEEGEMPFVNVKLIEGVFDADQKREIVERLTETMVGIEGENMREVTWVVVEEVQSGDWGIGGRALSTEDVKALAAGAAS
jgi:4-oxalocrotonate tautomerase